MHQTETLSNISGHNYQFASARDIEIIDRLQVSFRFDDKEYIVDSDTIMDDIGRIQEAEYISGGYTAPIYKTETVNITIADLSAEQLTGWLFDHMADWEECPE